MVLVLLVFLILLANLYQLQVKGFQEYQTRSNSNRIMILPVAPNRGIIYDRNGEILAENTPVFSLEIIPEETANLSDVLPELVALLDLDEELIEQFRTRLRQARRFPQIPFAENLTQEQVSTFAVNQHRFPGVNVEARLQRTYPHKDLFTHAIGYVGRINRQDVMRLRERELYANYAATRNIGKLGVERYYEDLLHGTVGYQTVESNNRGRVVRTLDFNPPSPGQDIVLELDTGLQRKAREMLGDRRGAIVVLNNRTGGVLAMYSNPSYDPNLFVGGISTVEYRELTSNQNNPLINRATQGRYPPASTIKPLLGVLGLESGTITPEEQVWDPGWYEIPNVSRRWRDWRRWGHGWVDLNKAIVESCNTYYYDLAYKLGIDKISEFMYDAGFGQVTGLDIHEESTAVMPSRDWKYARFGEPWYQGETLSVGIGQSFWTATPVQLATTTAYLVNRGEQVIPRLLKGSGEPDHLAPSEPVLLRNRELFKEEHWQPVMEAMADTVRSTQGTAYSSFRGANYTSGGKTGTAQVVAIADDVIERPDVEDVVEEQRANAVYIGFAPLEDPEVVVAIAIENVGGGGRNAAPVARAMFDYYFDHIRIEATEPPPMQEEGSYADD